MGEKKIKKSSQDLVIYSQLQKILQTSLTNNPIQQTDTFPTTSRCIAKVQRVHKCYIRSLFAL